MTDMLVVVSKIKKYVKGKEMSVGKKYIEELNVKVKNIIEESITRAKDNGRKTLQERDI